MRIRLTLDIDRGSRQQPQPQQVEQGERYTATDAHVERAVYWDDTPEAKRISRRAEENR